MELRVITVEDQRTLPPILRADPVVREHLGIVEYIPADSPARRVFAVLVGGELAGYAMAGIGADDEPTAYVTLVIIECHRGHGVGTEVARLAARLPGLRQYRLLADVVAGNVASNALVAAVGWVRSPADGPGAWVCPLYRRRP